MESTSTTSTSTPTILCNNFDKLGEMEAHLIKHRELFLSRQIETYKIDMVR